MAEHTCVRCGREERRVALGLPEGLLTSGQYRQLIEAETKEVPEVRSKEETKIRERYEPILAAADQIVAARNVDHLAAQRAWFEAGAPERGDVVDALREAEHAVGRALVARNTAAQRLQVAVTVQRNEEVQLESEKQLEARLKVQNRGHEAFESKFGHWLKTTMARI